MISDFYETCRVTFMYPLEVTYQISGSYEAILGLDTRDTRLG